MWGESTRVSQGKKDPMNPSMPPDRDTLVFNEKCRKFDETDDAFRTLSDALAAYKAAILNAADCGVAVAEAMHKFFAQPDHKQKQVVDKFRDAQLSIRSKWVDEAEKSFDAEIIAPIKNRLDEIPKVRKTIRARASYKADMEKRQKKLQADRKRDKTRSRDKQRRLTEITSQYTMFHNSVIKSFNYMERNMGTFVVGPLRTLVTILAEVSASTVGSLEQVVKLVAEAPPMTTELSPPPPLAGDVGGIVDKETWDNDFEEDSDREQEDEDEKSKSEYSVQTSVADRHTSLLPPRGRVHSSDSMPRTPNFPMPMDNLNIEFSAVTSPRNGRSTSSAPADISRAFSPIAALPLIPPAPSNSHREIAPGPNSASGRISQSGHDSFLPASSVASSTSTDNVGADFHRITPAHRMSMHRRGLSEGREVAEALQPLTSEGVRSAVIMKVVAKHNFFPAPRDTNELELQRGDIIEVVAKNDSGWWMGHRGRSYGYFPHNYTRPLTEEEEIALFNVKRKGHRRGHRRQNSDDSRKSGQTATPSQSSVQAM